VRVDFASKLLTLTRTPRARNYLDVKIPGLGLVAP
jgi:hypothetical protein